MRLASHKDGLRGRGAGVGAAAGVKAGLTCAAITHKSKPDALLRRHPYPTPQPCPPCLGLAPRALTSGAPNCTSVCSTRLTGSLLRPMRVVSLPSLHVPAPPSPGQGQGQVMGIHTTQQIWDSHSCGQSINLSSLTRHTCFALCAMAVVHLPAPSAQPALLPTSRLYFFSSLPPPPSLPS